MDNPESTRLHMIEVTEALSYGAAPSVISGRRRCGRRRFARRRCAWVARLVFVLVLDYSTSVM